MDTNGEKLRQRKTENNTENNGDPNNSKTQNGFQNSPQTVPTFGDPNQMQQTPSTAPYRTAAEYSQAVQQWLWQYHMWNQMNWFYMNFPLYSCNFGRPPASQSGQGPFPTFPSAQPAPGVGVASRATQNAASQRPQPPTNQQGAQGRTQTERNQRGQEFKIPPLWKRVFAEFIDFFLLFIVKLAVTIFFVEYIGLVDLRHYDLEFLMTTDMDYNTAFAMTSELIAMEIVNRVFICIFETLCLRKGLAGSVGGTTPGKRIMGLKVISCREIIDVPGNHGNKVFIVPAGNIGTWNAFVRSLIKNFSLAFFFPVCLTVFFFQHNRAAYDIIANCVIVETAELPPARWR